MRKILHQLQNPTLIHYLLSYEDKQELALSCGALLFGRSLARVVVKSDVQKIRDILGSQRRDWAIKNANALGLPPYPLADDINDEYFCQHGYALMLHICRDAHIPMLHDMLRHALAHDSDMTLQKSQHLAAAHIVHEALIYHQPVADTAEG